QTSVSSQDDLISLTPQPSAEPFQQADEPRNHPMENEKEDGRRVCAARHLKTSRCCRVSDHRRSTRKAERKPAQHRGSGSRAERNGQPGRLRRITASVVTEESTMVIEPRADPKRGSSGKSIGYARTRFWRRTGGSGVGCGLAPTGSAASESVADSISSMRRILRVFSLFDEPKIR